MMKIVVGTLKSSYLEMMMGDLYRKEKKWQQRII